MATARKHHRFVGTGQTVGAADVDLVTFAVPTNTVLTLEGYASGKTSAMESVSVALTGCAKRAAGNAAIVGLVETRSKADAALLSTSVSLAVSGSNLIFRATGVITQTVDWHGELLVWEN